MGWNLTQNSFCFSCKRWGCRMPALRGVPSGPGPPKLLIWSWKHDKKCNVRGSVGVAHKPALQQDATPPCSHPECPQEAWNLVLSWDCISFPFPHRHGAEREFKCPRPCRCVCALWSWMAPGEQWRSAGVEKMLLPSHHILTRESIVRMGPGSSVWADCESDQL